MKLIKLHFINGAAVYFNPALIREMYRADNCTMMWLLNDKECYNITETPQQIIRIIEDGNASI